MRFRSRIQSETSLAVSKANKIISDSTHDTRAVAIPGKQRHELSLRMHVHPCSTFGGGSGCSGDFDCDAGQRCALEVPPQFVPRVWVSARTDRTRCAETVRNVRSRIDVELCVRELRVRMTVRVVVIRDVLRVSACLLVVATCPIVSNRCTKSSQLRETNSRQRWSQISLGQAESCG